MKLYFLSFVLLANTVLSDNDFRNLQLQGFGNTPCATCFEKIDKARDCLRECNQKAYPVICGDDTVVITDPNADPNSPTPAPTKLVVVNNCPNNDDRQSQKDKSLLDYCLDDQSVDTVDDIDSLKDCCDFDDNKCDDYFDEVQECLITCINPCMITTAAEWLDCIRDNGDQGNCDRQECLDGFLDDLPDDLELDNNPDIFDLETVYDLVVKISEEDLQDCSLLHEFVTDTCDVGNDCCDKCQAELGSTVDCLLNDVIIPFARGALNTTVEECPINADNCKAGFRRELTQEEADKFNRVMNLPPRRKMQETTSVSTDVATACQRTMESDILAYNVSFATNKFMQCVFQAGYESLPDTEKKESAAATIFGVFAVFSSMLVALLM